MRILTSEQMQAVDRHAIDVVGLPSLVLMENAAAGVIAAIRDAFGDPAELGIVVLAGTGNNGGDGLAVARRLHALGCDVRAVLVGDPARLSPDAARQLAIARAIGIEPAACATAEDWARLRDAVPIGIASADLVVDALLGTGGRGPLRGLLAEIALELNALPVPVVCVDVPSGLSGSSPAAEGPVVRGSLTVALQALKICHAFPPASEACGEIVVVDIGIPDVSLDAFDGGVGGDGGDGGDRGGSGSGNGSGSGSGSGGNGGGGLRLIEDELVAPLLLPLCDREIDAHKGDFGHVLVVAGAPGTTGAAALAGLGALRGGAGLVTVATPEACVPLVAAHAPELMTRAVADDGSGAEALLAGKSVVVAGPGLGTGPAARRLLAALLELAVVPMVLDADALNLLSAHGLPGARPERPLVLTPHPGELARLAASRGDAPLPEDQPGRIPIARELARRTGAVVIVKGARTLVVGGEAIDDAASDGEARDGGSSDGGARDGGARDGAASDDAQRGHAAARTHVAVGSTGGPGMATGGTGDVLAGLVGALLAQGLPPREAAVAAVHLHGRAGDLAAAELGQMALLAGDLLRFLPAAAASILSDE